MSLHLPNLSYVKTKVNCHFHKSLQHESVLSQFNPLNNLSAHYSKIYFNIIFYPD
jgi:hypothetical protein